jgi:stage III sporulation protein AE
MELILKKLIILFIFLIILVYPSLCFAKEIYDQNTFDEILKQAGDLKEFGFDAINGNFDINGIFTYIKNIFLKEIQDVSKSLPVLITIIILYGMYASFDTYSEISHIVFLAIFSAFAIVSSGIFDIIHKCALNMIDELSKFVYLTIPFLTGLIASSGMVVTSLKSSFIILFSINILTYILNVFFVPLALLYFIFATVSTLMINDIFISIKNSIKSIVKISLPIIIAIFTASLSILVNLTKKTDELSLKSAKLAIGNLVPFLGNALSESSEVILTSIGHIKAQAGIVSIISMIYIFLIPIIKVLSSIIAFKFLSIISGFLSLKRFTIYCDDIASGLSILAGIMATMAIMVLIAIMTITN